MKKNKKLNGTERAVERNIYAKLNSRGDTIGYTVKVGNKRIHAPGQIRGTFKTLQAAKKARDNYIETIKDGAYSLCHLTLNEVFNELYMKGVNTGNKAERTRANQKNWYYNYIEPVLNGKREIRDFTRRDIKHLRDVIMSANSVKTNEPLSIGTKRVILVFAFHIFHFAFHEEYILNDICRGIDIPAQVKAKKECLSPEQIKDLSKEVERWFPNHLNLYAGFYLLLETGARVGEVCGLRWGDIDLTHNIIHIRQGISSITGKACKTKTPESVRDVYLEENLYTALCKLLEYRRKTGVRVKDTDYILTSTRGKYTGKNLKIPTFWITIVALGKRCGIKITPKTFRKTRATILLERGVHPMVVARQLGHTTTRMIETVYGDMDTLCRNAFPLMGVDRRSQQGNLDKVA